MHKLKKAGLWIFSGILIFCSMLYFLQEKLIFLPSKLDKNYRYAFEEPFEEIYLNRPDGAILNALHFRRKDPQGVILYFHGNAGDLSRWGEVVQELVRRNYDLVVMDYRTYGKSTGKLSEQALLEDAQAFYDYLRRSYTEDRIILYGRSLGTAMASYIASRNQISLLILETPFYSLLDVARSRFPFLPLEPLFKYPFRSFEFLKEADGRMIMIHGDQDEVVPLESARKLQQSLKGKPLEFILVPGGKHNNLSAFDIYQRTIDRLLLHGGKYNSM
jgi:fermentation-respiration switch protein FrsA (DUF1100 family)